MADPLRLAMIGMVPGNGHPFSWSAIVNGFDPAALAACPYPPIIAYLSRQDPAAVGIPGATVSHLWTDQPADAAAVARLAKIPNIAARPEDVIGEVDAVCIATDDGDDHVRRARPFVEAGLPVFVDKPLASNFDDLGVFLRWRREGARILSSSGLRYAPELDDLGDFSWQWFTGVSVNTWKRYGLHVLEPLFTLTGPDFLTVRGSVAGPDRFVQLTHRDGRSATLAILPHAPASFAALHLYGKAGHQAVTLADTYTAFRRQMLAFVEFARGGGDPFPFDHTVELMSILLAAEESFRQQGAEITLQSFRELHPELNPENLIYETT